MRKTKTVSKSYARQHFAEIVKEAEHGTIFYLSDRGSEAKVIVATTETVQEYKRPPSIKISQSSAHGLFAGRKDMEDSVAWVEKIRNERLKRIYGKKMSF